MKRALGIILVMSVMGILSGCGEHRSPTERASCTNIANRYYLSGTVNTTCALDDPLMSESVVVTQSGCDVNIASTNFIMAGSLIGGGAISYHIDFRGSYTGSADGTGTVSVSNSIPGTYLIRGSWAGQRTFCNVYGQCCTSPSGTFTMQGGE